MRWWTEREQRILITCQKCCRLARRHATIEQYVPVIATLWLSYADIPDTIPHVCAGDIRKTELAGGERRGGARVALACALARACAVRPSTSSQSKGGTPLPLFSTDKTFNSPSPTLGGGGGVQPFAKTTLNMRYCGRNSAPKYRSRAHLVPPRSFG